MSERLLAAQQAFVAAIRSARHEEGVLPLLNGDGARNRELLAVYRGNAVANASKALALSYPVISKIVGEEFFSGLARAYWSEYPSVSGDLNEYGEHFAIFLAGFPHVADMPYLPDVAALEWQVSRAACAQDHEPAPLSRLAEIPPEAVANLRFALQPALRFLGSAWPLADIWQQHQERHLGDIEIDMDQAQSVAVHRQGMRAQVVALDEATLAFWRAAQAGESLDGMLAAAFAVDAAFDVQTALQTGFAREFVTRAVALNGNQHQ